MTFTDWIAAGAAFGFKAFFAALVFVLCSGIALMLFGLIASFFCDSDDDDVQ